MQVARASIEEQFVAGCTRKRLYAVQLSEGSAKLDWSHPTLVSLEVSKISYRKGLQVRIHLLSYFIIFIVTGMDTKNKLVLVEFCLAMNFMTISLHNFCEYFQRLFCYQKGMISKETKIGMGNS